MKDEDYIWSAEGEGQPEVQALEDALSRYRWSGHVPDETHFEPRTPRRRGFLYALAAATLVALGAFLWRAGTDTERALDYSIEVLAGTPRFEGSKKAGGTLSAGDRLVCDASTRVRLQVGDLGSVELAPSSRLRVGEPAREGAPGADYLLHLEDGRLDASIFAAPRLFQLGTPAGIAVDLGCMYTARVEEGGATLLTVTAGLVSFESQGRRAIVPAGASTVALPGRGPGTPWWDDAPAELRAALERIDADAAPAAADMARVRALEDERDSLMLWHLVEHARVEVRASAFDSLSAIVPPPDGVTRAGCLAGETEMLDAWRAELSWDW